MCGKSRVNRTCSSDWPRGRRVVSGHAIATIVIRSADNIDGEGGLKLALSGERLLPFGGVSVVRVLSTVGRRYTVAVGIRAASATGLLGLRGLAFIILVQVSWLPYPGCLHFAIVGARDKD